MLHVIYQTKENYMFSLWKDNFEYYKTIDKLSENWSHERHYLLVEIK